MMYLRASEVRTSRERDGSKGVLMTFVLPAIVMVFFSALYAGAYIIMRRSDFGESGSRREKKRH